MPTHVDVEGIDGRKFEGRVERINPSAEPGTRTINIYVSLANEDSLLKTGMFARVLLTISPEAEVPALPLSAVRTEAAQPFVWVVADQKLARRNIVTGKRDERAQWVEVTSGLAPGEVVLATKFDNLKDGLAAKVISLTPIQMSPTKIVERRRETSRESQPMWMTRVSINHPVFATMVMVALTVLGLFSYAKLGVEAMPDVRPPLVSIKCVIRVRRPSRLKTIWRNRLKTQSTPLPGSSAFFRPRTRASRLPGSSSGWMSIPTA